MLPCLIEFDEGHLSIDPVAAQDEVEQTLAIMEETQPPVEADQNKVRYLFRTIWDRVKKVCRGPLDIELRVYALTNLYSVHILVSVFKRITVVVLSL